VAEKNGMRVITLDPPLVEVGQGREQTKEQSQFIISLMWFLANFLLSALLAFFILWLVIMFRGI
jgi:hypothetical protein